FVADDVLVGQGMQTRIRIEGVSAAGLAGALKEPGGRIEVLRRRAVSDSLKLSREAGQCVEDGPVIGHDDVAPDIKRGGGHTSHIAESAGGQLKKRFILTIAFGCKISQRDGQQLRKMAHSGGNLIMPVRVEYD